MPINIVNIFVIVLNFHHIVNYTSALLVLYANMQIPELYVVDEYEYTVLSIKTPGIYDPD